MTSLWPKSINTSITVRLSVLFAIVSCLTLAGMGVHIYEVLREELAARNREELAGKVDLVRHLLLEYEDAQAVANDPKRWQDVFFGHHGLHLNLLDEDRRLLVATSPLRIPPQALARTIPGEEAAGAQERWKDEAGTPYRLMTAWGHAAGRADRRLLIALAFELAEFEQVLATHRQHLVLAGVGATLIASLAAFFVVRFSLARLRDIARAASVITASDLGRRLDIEQAPDELKSLALAFNSMLQRLQESFERLSEFSSDIAHELRTPINNLLGQTQVALSQKRSAAELREVLESNAEEFERLGRMIEDMLFLARADNAQAVLHRERFDVSEELEKIASFFEYVCEEKAVRLSVRGTAQVYADRNMLQRALANVVSNAVRHTPAGGRVEAVAEAQSDGSARITVSDEGKGIADEHLDRIFDRFFRVEAAREDSSRGAGLGLAIVKSIMQLHGGRVSVRSRRGQGTDLTLHLPPFAEASRAHS